MSIDMNLPSAQSQSSGISTFVSSKNRGYSELITALNQFIMMTPNLQGATYESAKSYAQSVFLPLAQGAIMLNEAFSKSVSDYVSGYCSKVIGKSLKSSELEGKIAQRRAAITRLHEQMDRLLRMDKPQAKLLNSLKRRLDFELETVEELEELLQKLISFHAESASYFDNLDALYNAVQQGLSQLTSSWNPATNTFVLPAVNDMGWARIINQQWDDKTTSRAQDLIAKVESGKDLTSDELNELGGYLMENPESKLYDKGMKAFYSVLDEAEQELVKEYANLFGKPTLEFLGNLLQSKFIEDPLTEHLQDLSVKTLLAANVMITPEIIEQVSKKLAQKGLATAVSLNLSIAPDLVKEVGTKVIGNVTGTAINTVNAIDDSLLKVASSISNEGTSFLTGVSMSQSVKQSVGSAIKAAPFGVVVDFGLQVLFGENPSDASVKTIAHAGIGIGAAALGKVIGIGLASGLTLAVPVLAPYAPAIGTAIDVGLTTSVSIGASLAFDYVYDNWDTISAGINETLDKGKEKLSVVGEVVTDNALNVVFD